MSKISASRFRQRPIRRAKKVAYDVFLPPCSIWEPVNWAKLGEGEEMRQQRDRKRRFSATSKSSPVVLYGEITDGGGGLFSFSLKCWAAFAFSVHLCPSQPSLLHDNNLPICCKRTFPSFPSSVHRPLLPFVFSLPPTSIIPSIFPHYQPPSFPTWQNSSGPCIDQPNRRR